MTKLKAGSLEFDLTDPHNLMPVGCDMIAECVVFNQSIALAFASARGQLESSKDAIIVARLRLTYTTAKDLHDCLGNTLKALGDGPKTRN